MEAVAQLPCIVSTCGAWPVTIHHCGTGGGGRRDHMKVLPLCHHHHLGREGIDSVCTPKPYSKRTWQEKYGREDDLLEIVKQQLEMS